MNLRWCDEFLCTFFSNQIMEPASCWSERESLYNWVICYSISLLVNTMESHPSNTYILIVGARCRL